MKCLGRALVDHMGLDKFLHMTNFSHVGEEIN
jgi:hypothetical protein